MERVIASRGVKIRGYGRYETIHQSRIYIFDYYRRSEDTSPSRLYLSSSRGLIPTGTPMAGATGLGSSQLNGTIRFPPKEDFAIASYLVPDSVGRVFHPQQVGHALIANLIMYTMASREAVPMGMQPPPQELKNIGSSCPMAPSPACSGSSSHTWFSRDAAISAVSSFCQNYANLAGTAGKKTSATFNPNNFDYFPSPLHGMKIYHSARIRATTGLISSSMPAIPLRLPPSTAAPLASPLM